MNMVIKAINLDELDVDDEWNCRGTISPIDIGALAENIKEQGLLQPGVVMPHPDPNSGYKYKLVAGFRRHLAIKYLKQKTYNCVVKEGISDSDAMFLNLNENLQREDLNILQEAKAIDKIKSSGFNQGRKDCAKKLGKSEGWIQIREMLLDLPSLIQQEVVVGLITQTEVRELNTVLKKQGEKACFEVAKEIKVAKLAGRKPRIKKKKNRHKIKERNRNEIFEMMADLNDSIPYIIGDTLYLWPKFAAWAAGNISDNELFEFCKKFCDQEGFTWTLPVCDAREVVPGIDDD